MKLACEIIEDLLPLYADHVCSYQSSQAVTEHLKSCEKCRKLLEDSKVTPVLHIEPDHPTIDRAVKNVFKKIRFRWWATIFIIIALVPIAFLGWNEYSSQGVAYTNLDELMTSHAFMDCLLKGKYAKAYSYWNVESIKKEWLETWYDEETLSSIETDGQTKFCELGKKLDEYGGITNYEYIGISLSCIESDGTKVYRVLYRIQFAGKGVIAQLYISNGGVEQFGAGGSFVNDPLAQFSIWSEYLWQDYMGCYYDPQKGEYIYYKAQ